MVVENLGNAGSEFQLEFDNLLLIVHYYTFRAAMKSLTGLDDQIAKISTSLLRYTEIIPADKAFYEAGLACRAAKKPEMAMIFMNRFLDLVEAIENDDGMLDPEGFEETEIPVEVPLPDKVCLPQSDVEEIRNWVLNMSIDQRNLNHQLPMDKRGTFEGNLKGGRPCIVTGYPILGQTVQFRRGRAANNTDWRALIHQVSRVTARCWNFERDFNFYFRRVKNQINKFKKLCNSFKNGPASQLQISFYILYSILFFI